MKLLRRSTALVYGFALAYCVCIWLTGFMDARGVPREYFQFFSQFGIRGKEVGLALIYVALHLIPTVTLLVLGVLGPAWFTSKHRREVGRCIIAGSIASYLFWTVFYSFSMAGNSFETLLEYLRAIIAQWWAYPALIAPILGFVLAALLLSKLSPDTTEA
jgi:hypothetical protein